MKLWKIEYEIPPTRAIWLAECQADTEQEVRDAVKEHEPLWVIRKIEFMEDLMPS